MKRVAILTRRAGYNMGSSLQAYAMYKFINNLGYDAEILDYDEYSHFLMWRIKPFINKLIWQIFNIYPHVAKKLFACKYESLKISATQMEAFKQFEKQFMPISKTKYCNLENLKNTLGYYDAYVCGSDQIWSPYMFDPVFYLGFISNNNNKFKKIAYAPSIGVSKREFITEEQVQLIKQITYVSCRENSGAKILSEIVGKEIPVVLDPTLMLDRADWESLLSSNSSIVGKDYVLTYFLHRNDMVDNIPNKFIKRLKDAINLPIINIQMHNLPQVVEADEQIMDANPQDFITLIRNAKCVVTNSFHACVFSFIFSKKFFVFERFSKTPFGRSDQNPRIHNFLQIINMEQSLIKDENILIDLDSVQNIDLNLEKFMSLKNSSKRFILDALK